MGGLGWSELFFYVSPSPSPSHEFHEPVPELVIEPDFPFS